MIEVMQPGSPVTVGGAIKGTILKVCLGERNAVEYLVSWWNGNERNAEWLQQIEVVRRDETQAISIGFFSQSEHRSNA